MKKRLTLLNTALFLLGLVQIVQAAPAPAPSVYFDFNGDSAADTAWSINAGDLFSADVYASGFVDVLGGDHGGLIGYGFQVSFDPLLATASSAAVAAPWLSVPPSGVAPGNASLSGLYLAFPPLPGLATTPPLKLGSINFTSLGAGAVNLDLADLHAYSDFGAVDGFDFDGLITFQDALVTAAPPGAVPLPATVWLFGAGLAGMVGFRKKNRNPDR